MTSFEFVGVNLWFYSPSMLVGLRHSLARKLILGSGLKPFPSRVFPSGGIGIQMLEGRDICRAIGLPASTCLAVPPHRRDGIAWERGRPARILSLWPPLSFSAMPQSRCRRQLPCGREPHRPGRRRAMATCRVDPSGGDGRGCARLGADGTPALPGSHHPMTSSHQGHKIAQAFGCR